MFRVCIKNITKLSEKHSFHQRGLFSLKDANQIAKSLPKYKENNSNTNIGIVLGAGVGMLGAFYFLKSDPDITVREYNDESGANLIRKRIKATYGYVLGGIGITSVSAYGFFKAGLPKVITRTNPWVYLGVSLATSIPLMIGTMVTDYESDPVLKHILWGGFNVSMAGSLSIICLLGGPLIAQAGLATGCIVGGLSLIASKAKPGSLQQYEGALGLGLGGLVAVGMGNMIFPMPILHNIMLYGGLAVFSGLTMTDTQKIMMNAQNSCMYDPVNESLAIYLDTLNIFIRTVQILESLQNKKK